MSVNANELRESEFYRKKLRRATEMRDINRDGTISRHDFELIVQRYKDLIGVPEEQLKDIRLMFLQYCDFIGLVDHTKRMSFKEYEKKWMDNLELYIKNGPDSFMTYFDVADHNRDGEISYQEWVDYYKVLDIDTKHARASFDAMDTDGDGKISREEFVAYNQEYLFSIENNLKSSIMYGPL